MKVIFIRHKVSTGGLPSFFSFLEEAMEIHKVESKTIVLNNPLYINLTQIKDILSAEIIHPCVFTPNVLFVLLLCKAFKIPTISTIHGDYFKATKGMGFIKSILWILLIDLGLKLSTKISTPSNHLKNIIIHNRPSFAKKISVIYNGVNKNKLKKSLFDKVNEKYILQVTDFHYKQKALGVKTLCEEFDKSGVKCKLKIIGGRDLMNDYKKRYASERIEFLGRLSHEETLRYIASAQLLINCSYLDNMPISILEAMSLKTPVISNKVGAIKEMLNQKLIIKTSKIHSEIKTILSSSKTRERYIRLTEEKKDLFSIKKVSNDYLLLYNSLIGKN